MRAIKGGTDNKTQVKITRRHKRKKKKGGPTDTGSKVHKIQEETTLSK